MNSPEDYPWEAAYVSAISEADNSKMIGRITTALQAIDDRLVSSAEIGDLEYQAIREAWKAVAALKSECVDWSV